MKSLFEYIQEAEQQNRAIGHFNVATIDMLWAVFVGARNASEKCGTTLPVIIGVSEGERDFLGAEQVALVVRDIRERFRYPVFLNADHTYSVEKVQQAIDAGFDMAIYDGAKESYADNVVATEACVSYRNEIGSGTLLEAEIGYIGSGSNIKTDVPEGVSEETMTKPQEAKQFVDDTGVDLIAPSVGNIHGMISSGNPELHPDRVKEIREAAGVPLVLHGGSGSSDDDFRAAITAGISIVHVSTALRVMYRKTLEKSLQASDELAPYKYLAAPKEQVAKEVERFILLFSNT